MYQSLVLVLLTIISAPTARAAPAPVANGCWRGEVDVTLAPASKPSSKQLSLSLIFSGKEEFAHALLIKNGAREYVTDFQCDEARAMTCTLLDDGGSFRFERKDAKTATLKAGLAIAVDDRESVRHARITTDGFDTSRPLTALAPAECAREQARVRALFIHGAEVD